MDNLAHKEAYYSEESTKTIVLHSSLVYEWLKKILDVVGSLVGLILCLPVFLVVALFIKVEDPKGKVFFSQTRVGLNGKEFRMYKFRSMYEGAEGKLDELLIHNEVEGAMFKMKDDPRITKIGKFIRKTSIDELPQFVNVLLGDMSLVGPRPPLPREVEKYNDYELQRLYVKPGCTGLWQVSGRNSLPFSEMVKLDLEYIENRSFLYDLTLIVKTVGIVIKPNDAY